nr:hypothetical protein [Bradyrhizobium valentinum]
MKQVKIADHHTQHVPEIVDDASGQATDGLQLAGVEQIRLEGLPVADIKPEPKELAAAVLLAQDGMVKDVLLRPVRATPAVFDARGAGLFDVRKRLDHPPVFFGIESGLPQIRLSQEIRTREARQAPDAIVGEAQPSQTGTAACRVKRNRQRLQHKQLMLLAVTQPLLGSELFLLNAQVLQEQPLFLVGKPAYLLGLSKEIDEDVDLRAEKFWIDRLENTVDCAGGTAARDRQFVGTVSREKNNRNPRSTLIRLHPRGHLKPVKIRHAHIKDNSRKIILARAAQHLPSGSRLDNLAVRSRQHRVQRHQTPRIITGDQNFGFRSLIQDPRR